MWLHLAITFSGGANRLGQVLTSHGAFQIKVSVLFKKIYCTVWSEKRAAAINIPAGQARSARKGFTAAFHNKSNSFISHFIIAATRLLVSCKEKMCLNVKATDVKKQLLNKTFSFYYFRLGGGDVGCTAPSAIICKPAAVKHHLPNCSQTKRKRLSENIVRNR